MPDPNVIGAIGRKKQAQEIQAWDSPDRESQLSMIQAVGASSKESSVIGPSTKMLRSRRDSEEIVTYSRNEAVA
jgi:hypothetical protein